jgi:predicted AAA+ superfamily ATPase
MKLSRIIEYNPWWDTGDVRKELCPPFERLLLGKVLSSLNRRNVTVIRGPRRTGKSTLMYQAIRNLLSNGVDSENILYFSFDDELGVIEDLLLEYRDSVLGRAFEDNKRLFIFLDEAQKCKNWAEQVKRYYDLYPNIKFVLSGSVSFELGMKTTESLAGRVIELVLFPMTFGEYLGLKGIKPPPFGDPVKHFIMAERRLRPHFKHFLKTGGFPELVNEKDINSIVDYVKSSIIRRVVYGDLIKLGSIGDPELMMALVRAISERPGILLNYENLKEDFRRDRRTISSYISLLEYSMVIRTLGNLRPSSFSSSRKHRKAYPVSSAMTFAFKGNDIDESDLGRVIEIAIMNEINARYYWRHRGKEVDFVLGKKGETAVEVKYGKGTKLHFEQYKKVFKLKNAFVISKDELGGARTGSVQYQKIPAWALCAGARIEGIKLN